MDPNNLPNVIILTDECVSLAHGTGTTLARHFADYPPEKLLNIHWAGTSQPVFKNTLRVEVEVRPNGNSGGRIFHFWRRIKRSLLPVKEQPSTSSRRQLTTIQVPSIRPLIDRLGFAPDVIYANCYGLQSFRILARLAQEYHGELPILQHFHDYLPDYFTDVYSRADLEMELRAAAPLLIEIWALTPTIAEDVSKVMGRPLEIVNTFRIDIPAHYKTEHREFGPDFTAVIMGNIWMPDLIKDICAAWRWAGEILGGLQPIQWLCHPDAITRVKSMGIKLEPELAYAGFFQGEALYDKLRQADISIIPFNRQENPENNYARYSLPSRITETAAMGLPMFVIAGSQTGVAQYVNGAKMGVCAALSAPDSFRETLLTFIRDCQLRADCGHRARDRAEQDFDLRTYRNFLYGKLAGLAKQTKG